MAHPQSRTNTTHGPPNGPAVCCKRNDPISRGMIHLLFHVMAYGVSIPAAKHLASEPDVPCSILGKRSCKESRVAITLVLGIARQLVAEDATKRSLHASHARSSIPD